MGNTDNDYLESPWPGKGEVGEIQLIRVLIAFDWNNRIVRLLKWREFYFVTSYESWTKDFRRFKFVNPNLALEFITDEYLKEVAHERH